MPCLVCSLAKDDVWLENEDAIAFSCPYPVADGHTLVAPRRHVITIYDLEIVEQSAIWELVAQVRELVNLRLKPDGFTIGFNDGLAIEQTIRHAHVQIIPRRYGDSLTRAPVPGL